MNLKKEWWKLLLVVIGMLYLSNIGAGVIEFIPDNIPIVGNLDEGVAGSLIYAGLVGLIKK